MSRIRCNSEKKKKHAMLIDLNPRTTDFVGYQLHVSGPIPVSWSNIEGGILYIFFDLARNKNDEQNQESKGQQSRIGSDIFKEMNF